MGSRHEERGSREDRDRRSHGDRSTSCLKDGHRSRPPAKRQQDRLRDDSRARDRPRSPRRARDAAAGGSSSRSQREREQDRERESSGAREGRGRLHDAQGRDSPRSCTRKERRPSPGRRTDSPLAERNHRSRREERRPAEKAVERQPPPACERRAAEPARERRLRPDAPGRARDQSHRDSPGRPSAGVPPPPLPPNPSRQPQRQPPPPPPPLQPAPPPAALDFFSAAFDAALALRTPGLQPPNPAVQPLQMLQQCRFILPAELPESLAEAHFQHKSQEARDEARARSGPAARRRQAAELRHSVVDRIAAAVTKGPLLLLRRCFEAGARVRVVTRHARGVRGWAEGALMAFDKHLNLVLADVEEAYTVRLRVQRTTQRLRLRPAAADQPAQPGAGEACQEAAADAAGASPPPEVREGGYELEERTRTAFRQEHRRRRLKQIFVRGSNVVLVSAVPPAAQPG